MSSHPLKSLNLPGIDVRGSEKLLHKYRLLFLHKGKIVWEGMTHEFTTSTNPIVQQVSKNLSSCLRILLLGSLDIFI